MPAPILYIPPSLTVRSTARAIKALGAMLLVVLLASSPLAVLGPTPVGWAAGSGTIGEPTTATPLTHQLIFYQGEDPETTVVEPASLLQVLDRTVWRIPWNETVVYASIPSAAKDIVYDNVEPFSHAGLTVFRPGPFSADVNPSDPPSTGRVSSGPLSGLYFWRMPTGASRALGAVRNPFTEGKLADYDPAATTTGAWTIGNRSLELKAGVTEANYTGKSVELGHDIETVNVTWSGAGVDENVTVQVSADDGATWVEAVNGTPRAMDGLGAKLRWRIGMVQDPALNNTPVLTNMSVRVVYVPEYNEVWMNLEYELELDDDGALDMTIGYPFDSSQTALIFLGYFDSHVELKVEGMEMTASTSESFPGKLIYRHMQGPYAEDLVFKVETVDDSTGSGTTVLIVLGVLLILTGIFLYFYMGSRERRHDEGEEEGEEEGAEDDEAAEEDVDEGEEPEEDEADEEDASDEAGEEPVSGLEDLSLEELTKRKEDILHAIKRADGELEQGILGAEEHAAIRASYKRRALQVMKAIEDKKR